MDVDSVHHSHLTLVGTFLVLVGLLLDGCIARRSLNELQSATYFVCKAVYILCLDDLRHIPGPKINAISRIPHARHLVRGTIVDQTVDLHRRYGDVVRLTPNEVSFASIDSAFTDIYGFRTGKLKGQLNMQKDPSRYAPPPNATPSIFLGNDEVHNRARRTLSHAFSERALAGQEPLLQDYVDQLVDKLKGATSKSRQPVDLAKWYNWTTFDIIADLLFGEPFGCLKDQATHKYITMLLRALEGFSTFYVRNYFPIVNCLGSLIVNKDAEKNRVEFSNWISTQAQKRRDRDAARPDFMTYILAHNGQKGEALTDKEIDTNCSTLLGAGSETTATLLTGATYLLLTHPEKLQKLKAEIRGKWQSYDEITIEAVNSTPYLIAVLAECLRFFPPAPAGFERRVGKGGAEVSGYFIPEGTAVSVSHYAAYHSPNNFTDPDAFVPERWMGEERYANDKRAWCQPFSYGPRNCLGKNLAYAEMRLIMAKMVWSFDWELEDQSLDWMSRCTVATVWKKPEMLVKLTEVSRA